MREVQLIPHLVQRVHRCMEQVVNVVIHSLRHIHIPALQVVSSLGQHALSPIQRIGNAL